MYSHQTISLEKYVSPSIIFFDAFYDRVSYQKKYLKLYYILILSCLFPNLKGMLYLFSGNKYTSQVKVLAVNVQRGQIAKLSSYDLDQNEAMIRDQHELEEDQETKNKPFSATTLANETKLFKRKDDQLILIKRDASLIVHNLIDNEIVFNKQLRSLHDAAIGCLNGDAVIFAACGRQSIINLLN